ncbi:DUF3667 domain-containing protein [Tenacibaculum tangerinum]|uniref:DUF3667 domain-containing protein n=1 Tax=Tenacibaculum tangerinum TaxID=3038772 RepID=A0ABY8L2J2_9FLAO|nr:DUF3667 domain-containing protein [Tenacibaculum tangerinum]WGH74204.1 DUF3667 domain-containing protein [Tenacibaculum tangerinum]
MTKKNTIVVVKDASCLNCGYPFTHNEKFCPECGQKNKGKKITFGSFIREVFAGFFSWDAKFWKTLIPLIISPGTVSKNYIDGKRSRYTNPFRFYITTSVIFFLIVNLTDSYNDFKNLNNDKKQNANAAILGVQDAFYDSKKDSVAAIVLDELKNKKIDSTLTANELDSVVNIDSIIKNKKPFLNVAGKEIKINRMLTFQKEYPEVPVNDALDSLQIKKTFSNRFWYSRTELINSFFSKTETQKALVKQFLSYSSVALFILLPLFTLSLKLLYFRRKFTYIEHLVFVFHTQTVFFILISIFYILDFIGDSNYTTNIFLLLFMIYLFIAMKKFYNQGYFKTFIKYCIANTLFFILGAMAFVFISFAVFALY